MAKHRVIEHAAAIAVVEARRGPAQGAQAPGAARNEGDIGALMGEQYLGVGPALVLLADQVVRRHADIVEENLVHLRVAIHQHDGLVGNAGRVHVDEQEADALLLLHRGVGAD